MIYAVETAVYFDRFNPITPPFNDLSLPPENRETQVGVTEKIPGL